MKIHTIGGACIVKNGKILLLKQSDNESDGQSGAWGPPAGHGEDGEKLRDTAIRETKEESNLDVKLTGIVECGLFHLSDGRIYLIVLYSGSVKSFKNIRTDGKEVTGYKWVDLKELENITLRHPLLKPILRKALLKMPYPLDFFTEIEVII